MQQRNRISSAILRLGALLLTGVLLGGCAADRAIHRMRAQSFPQPRDKGVSASVKARALYLKAAPNGGLTAESIKSANTLLTVQGPLRRQILTIVPLSPAGDKIAPRLAKALEAAGARSPRSGSYDVKDGAKSAAGQDLKRQQHGWDLELISEALVVDVTDCSVADPDNWTINPYYAVGTLGCANEANIAMMTSDPRDLLRPRALAPAEGKIASSAIERYYAGEVNDLIDIDFSGDD